MILTSALDTILHRLAGLVSEPDTDNRPTPSIGEAWMISGVDEHQPVVTTVRHDDSADERVVAVC